MTPELEHILRDLRAQRRQLDVQLNDADETHRSVDEILEKLKELRLRAEKTSNGDLADH